MSSIQMMLNELSANILSENKYKAMQKMETFLSTIKVAIDQGISRHMLLQSEININNLELSEGYFVFHWRNDLKADVDKKHFYQLFLSILNGTQLVENIDNYKKEFILENGINSSTFLKCYQDEHIALSLTAEEFSKSNIKGQFCYLDHDGTLCLEEANVRHISVPEHLNDLEIKAFILNINKRDILSFTNGVELWERREALFPTLVFCGNVMKQIMSIEKNLLIECVKKIIMLEHYFSAWNWKYFDYKNIPNTSPESEQTLIVYEKQHTFETPFEEIIVVSYHIKGAAFDNRVYFYIDFNNKKIIICSVGKHLPCVTYGI